MKTAIIILSDPNSAAEEALGRAFNALSVAHELHAAGETVKILFLGTGTRWPAALNKPAHPFNGLYKSVVEVVEGVSCGCADAFGADDQGLPRLTDNAIPGTSGLPSFLALQREGWTILTF